MAIDVSEAPDFHIKKSLGTEPKEGFVRITKKVQLQKLNTKTLVAMFNSLTSGHPVNRFSDRDTAIDHVWSLIQRVTELPPKDGDDEMPEAKKATSTKEKKPKVKKPREETETVQAVLKLLRRKEGATKEDLRGALPNAQPAYLSALVTRGLREKGYPVTKEKVEGARTKRYFLAHDKGPDIDRKAKAAAVAEA